MEELSQTSGWRAAVQECLDAISLLAEWKTDEFTAAEYKLVAAHNLFTAAGGRVWRLTLKPRDLLPAGGKEAGAGGELFLKVDLEGRTVTIAGHGE